MTSVSACTSPEIWNLHDWSTVMDYIATSCTIIFLFWEVDKVWLGKTHTCTCIWLEYFEHRSALKAPYVHGKTTWVKRLSKYRSLLTMVLFTIIAADYTEIFTGTCTLITWHFFHVKLHVYGIIKHASFLKRSCHKNIQYF